MNSLPSQILNVVRHTLTRVSKLKNLIFKIYFTKTIFMNRNSFLKLSLAVGSFLITPFALMAKSLNKKRVDKGIKVDAGKDRFNESISLFQGDNFFCKVSTKYTEGGLLLYAKTEYCYL